MRNYQRDIGLQLMMSTTVGGGQAGEVDKGVAVRPYSYLTLNKGSVKTEEPYKSNCGL